MHIRVSAAIMFKNYTKRNWRVVKANVAIHLYLVILQQDEDGVNNIHEDDRNAIKMTIVDLMLKNPEQIQKQVSSGELRNIF